jgi:uncharacterized protein YjbJ (UPF0337 family)
MNWDEIEGNWKKFKGDIKERWGRLTDDDLDIIQGQREKLTGELQRKYGIAKEEAKEEIEDFLRKERQEAKSY